MENFMKNVVRLVLTLAAVCAITWATVRAGEPTKFSGKIEIGVHEVTMKEGVIYIVKVEGDGFRPQVQMNPGFLNQIGTSFGENKPYEGFYYAERNQIHTFYVVPQIFGLNNKKGPFDYKLSVTPVALAAKPLLNVQDTLANTDAPWKNQFNSKKHHKPFPVKLEAGQFYIIDMMRRGDNQLDCYLYLEDEDGKIVASNDDGGGMLNSRIVYNPQKAGTHRIIATHLFDQLGDFTVSVRSQQKD